MRSKKFEVSGKENSTGLAYQFQLDKPDKLDKLNKLDKLFRFPRSPFPWQRTSLLAFLCRYR